MSSTNQALGGAPGSSSTSAPAVAPSSSTIVPVSQRAAVKKPRSAATAASTSSAPHAPSSSLSSSSSSRSSSGSKPRISSSYHSLQHLPHEERMPKAWKNLVSCIIQGCFLKAEKVAKEMTKESAKELDDAVLMFIRSRMEWHHLISRVESRIQGQEQELEALDNYVQTMPKLGKRKRKQADTTSTPTAAASAPAVAAPLLTVPAIPVPVAADPPVPIAQPQSQLQP